MPPMPNVGAGNSIRPDGHLKGDRGEFSTSIRFKRAFSCSNVLRRATKWGTQVGVRQQPGHQGEGPARFQYWVL